MFGWRTAAGPPVYLDRSMCGGGQQQQHQQLMYHIQQQGLGRMAEAFGALMGHLADMVSPGTRQAVHLFYEPPLLPSGEGRREVYGFNRGGALWFSLRAFSSLHAGLPSVWAPECTSFWLVTLLHELAHNEVAEHGVRHATLLERMLERFTPRLIVSHIDSVLQQRQQMSAAHWPASWPA